MLTLMIIGVIMITTIIRIISTLMKVRITMIIVN